MESNKLDLIDSTLRQTLPGQLENLIGIKKFLELILNNNNLSLKR